MIFNQSVIDLIWDIWSRFCWR